MICIFAENSYCCNMDINQIRSMFPALDRKVYGKSLVYLDNAATSQKPVQVLDMYASLSRNSNGNIHRAVHALSSEATEAYEAARESVRKYINASAKEEIIFTSGTTASVNIVADSFTRAFVSAGDRILVSASEHHSNLVPWQIACMRTGARLEIIPLTEDGSIDTAALESMLDDRVKLVSVCHISNVLGVVNPVKEIVDIAHRYGVPVMIDGAQGIVHQKVDVRALDCDFYVFSGHKIYAPTGTGILYGKEKYLEKMPPYMGGGDMVGTVTYNGFTCAELPLKFEAGTSNFIAHCCWTPALEFASMLYDGGENERQIAERDHRIVDYVMNGVESIGGIKVLGPGKKDRSNKIPLFSLAADGIHPTDLAQIMDKMGIALRSGMMCSEPLLASFGLTAALRASFLPYNTESEAEYFISSLERAVSMLR